jgi:hypothetical protein
VKNRYRRHSRNVVVGDTDEIDLKAALRGVAANFVHSLDAAHLQRTVVAAARVGNPMLTIHDCYAALAPDAAQLNAILREEFVKMYTEHDPLAEVLARAARSAGCQTAKAAEERRPRLIRHPQLVFLLLLRSKQMEDLTQRERFSEIVWEAAQFRTLRAIVRADPNVSPKTARIIRDAFRRDAVDDLRAMFAE